MGHTYLVCELYMGLLTAQEYTKTARGLPPRERDQASAEQLEQEARARLTLVDEAQVVGVEGHRVLQLRERQHRAEEQREHDGVRVQVVHHAVLGVGVGAAHAPPQRPLRVAYGRPLA